MLTHEQRKAALRAFELAYPSINPNEHGNQYMCWLGVWVVAWEEAQRWAAVTMKEGAGQHIGG